jgi:hypothetical protein
MKETRRDAIDCAAKIQEVKKRSQASKSVIHKSVCPGQWKIGGDEIRYVHWGYFAKRFGLDEIAEGIRQVAILSHSAWQVVLSR